MDYMLWNTITSSATKYFVCLANILADRSETHGVELNPALMIPFQGCATLISPHGIVNARRSFVGISHVAIHLLFCFSIYVAHRRLPFMPSPSFPPFRISLKSKPTTMLALTAPQSEAAFSSPSTQTSMLDARDDITVEPDNAAVGLSNREFAERRRRMLDLINKLHNTGWEEWATMPTSSSLDQRTLMLIMWQRRRSMVSSDMRVPPPSSDNVSVRAFLPSCITQVLRLCNSRDSGCVYRQVWKPCLVFG